MPLKSIVCLDPIIQKKLQNLDKPPLILKIILLMEKLLRVVVPLRRF